MVAQLAYCFSRVIFFQVCVWLGWVFFSHEYELNQIGKTLIWERSCALTMNGAVILVKTVTRNCWRKLTHDQLSAWVYLGCSIGWNWKLGNICMREKSLWNWKLFIPKKERNIKTLLIVLWSAQLNGTTVYTSSKVVFLQKEATFECFLLLAPFVSIADSVSCSTVGI